MSTTCRKCSSRKCSRARYTAGKGAHGPADDNLENLHAAVKTLRKAAADLGISPPGKQFAVIRLDADNMGRLLLGDPDVIAATWKDVIHPNAVKP
ncbi:MAG: hypothetical protein R2762_06620 [Bryobacteraceae bacterium]